MFSGAKNSASGTVRPPADEPPRLLFVVAERREQRLHLRRQSVERAELVRELVDRHHLLVPLLFVVGERLGEGSRTCEPLIHCVREQLGIAERVRDAQSREQHGRR
jgi:hypothetical protein